MSKIKVLIVEDELIIAEDMKEILHELEYEVTGIACDSAEARELINSKEPDIALVDIQLRDGDDGISLAGYIRQNHSIPIVFITSHSDKNTVDRAKEVKPDGYIVKPFEKGDLYSSIEIAMSNFFTSGADTTQEEDNSYFFKEYLFIKKKYQFEKVGIHDIQWIKSEGNYLEMYCNDDRKYLIRSTFGELFQNINLETFIQVHKSYAVNFEYIDSVRPNELLIGKTIIPVGKKFKENIKKKLNIIF